MTLLIIAGQGQGVSINEIMSNNEATIADQDGDYSDWIELYNDSFLEVNLSGWYLSDDGDNPMKWQIESASIPSGSFLLVFASDKDLSGPGELHTNFKISSAGEALYLISPEGLLVDATPAVSLAPDVAYGNTLDGQAADRIFFGVATPGASNSGGFELSAGADEIEFSEQAGFYSNAFELMLNSAIGAEIRYTLDGSRPTTSSPLYSSSITIADRQNEADGISGIDTGIGWESPRSNGEKATVVKAASFINGIRISPIYTESYFISNRIEARYAGLPVVSLSVDSDSLFSYERGIYVAGENLSESWLTGTGNYFMKGRNWEREVHVEFFGATHQKEFAQQLGARIHGNTSRYHPQKTLRLYARGEYGSSQIEYPFFDDKEITEFKRILLRNSSADFGGTMFKDILCSELITEMDMDYMAAQVCVVFINGEYWGVHSIRERIDEHFLAENHGVSPDSLDLLALNAEVEEGDAISYNELLDYVSTHDLSKAETYSYVSERVDISNFMDYNITQIYLSNYDWPNVNIRYWQGHDEEYKWRWIFYDCDRCMLLPDYDHLIDVVQPDNQFNGSPEWTTLLFNRLLKNKEFKEEFIQRFFYHLSTTFDSDRVLSEINTLEGIYQPLVVEHINRWNYPASVNEFNESVQELKAFVIKRPAVMVQQLMDYIGEQYTLYPNPVSRDQQYVRLDMEYTEGVDTRIEVYSTLGELLLTMELDGLGEGEHPQIPISDLSAGLYIVKLRYGALVFSEKLMVD